MVDTLYGISPCPLGKIDISPKEMMFWLYCPIKMRNVRYEGITDLLKTTPANLHQFAPIIERAMDSVISDWLTSRYVYITAKTLWVTPDNPGNRKGWHADGFMTDDLNFIWADRNPTLFWVPDEQVSFIQDHHASLAEMENAAERDVDHHRTYGDKKLLMLDQRVIHRVADIETAGMRTFVKISVSKDRYNLIGNSINHLLPMDWDYFERQDERNCPIGKASQ